MRFVTRFMLASALACIVMYVAGTKEPARSAPGAAGAGPRIRFASTVRDFGTVSAGEVVKELKVKLLGAAPKVRTTDPKAYALYLQARELGRQFTAEAYAKSDALRPVEPMLANT